MGFGNIDEAQAFVDQYDPDDVLDISGVSLLKRHLGQRTWSDDLVTIGDAWRADFKTCGSYVDRNSVEWAIGVIFDDGEIPLFKDIDDPAELSRAISEYPELLDGSIYTYNADPAIAGQMSEEELQELTDDITKDGALDILTYTSDDWADLLRKLHISDADRIIINRASGITVALDDEWDK